MTIYTKNKDTQVLLIQQSMDFIQKGFSNMDKIKWITYKADIPEFIYEILNQKLLYFSTQMRLQEISSKTWIKLPELRRMLKKYTISELEKCKLKRGKIIIWECIDDKNNFTYKE